MNTKIAIAAVLAATAGLAQAETDLSLARSYELTNAASGYDSLLSNYNASNVKVKAQIQARYQYNERQMNDDTAPYNSDNDTTMGFSIRRTKVEVSGDVTDNISAKVKFAFSRSSGAAALEDAYGKWKINDDVTLKIGQFKQSLLREENMSSSKQLASERSAVNETFNQGFSQGIEASFGGDSWRGAIGFTDGIGNAATTGTANTAFNASNEADYALNARFDFIFGDAEWGQFGQFTSWRGSASGGMIGAAIAFQSMGSTNPALANDVDMTTGTIDFSYVSDGWNLFAAGVWRNMDTGAGTDMDDFGVIVQGGFFITDQDELFGRWDAIFPDSNNAPADEDFNALTFGWNHYLVPESHAAKFTLDLNYYLDASDSASTIVSTSSSGGHNLLSDTDDGQFGITAQFQFLF
ncbi:MAG: porin [Phycisphaerales bacterium JB052]